MKTRDQERAKHALEHSRNIDAKDAEFAKKLPVLIQTCGLAQAIAFAQAKEKAPRLLHALEEWIKETIPLHERAAQGILRRIIEGERGGPLG